MQDCAGLDLRGLRRTLLDFDTQLLKAAGQFRGSLPIKQDSIFAAVEFERRLSQDVLVLPQFALKLIGAR